MFSCLLIGSPGTGKTTVASTAPGPVLFLDVDNKIHKMENLKDKLSRGEIIQWAVTEPLAETTLSKLALLETKPGSQITAKRPKGYLQLADMIDKLVDSKCVVDGKKIGTVVLDSYTSMNEHLKRLLMAVNSTNTMTLPLYGTVLLNYETLNNTLLSLPCNVIFICHEKVEKDEITGAVSYKPLIDGQMADKIGKDFEEVYFMEKKISGDKVSYEMLTIGSSSKACRTSRVLPSRVPANFKEIYK